MRSTSPTRRQTGLSWAGAGEAAAVRVVGFPEVRVEVIAAAALACDSQRDFYARLRAHVGK